ncbi:MAG: mechanosensitive ion channel [Algoriphagus sp.]|uniref:mechanosensitive ion channel family protein n=1 Tax=Algoriphagus sp. TaxID=1872435 RepID=UPI002608D356|nr:mechanosensitive ion channel domain-containing protein [Algoriphagus sp.]MDG1279463.1 mechanosensitive ion channel [Algoriphagus sp.]
MNQLKSIIKSKENVRRRNFFIKLAILFGLEFLYEGNSFLTRYISESVFIQAGLRALIFLLSANLIISLGRIAVLKFYLQKTDDHKVQPNFMIGIDRISWILNVNILLIAIMLAFNIKPLEFLTSITIVAAAIALLTKDYITNIVNGLIIMFSEQLEIGDKITVGKNTGFIRDITLVNLVLKGETGEIILVPNNMIFSSDVVNYSKNDSHQVIIDSEIPFHSNVQLNELESSLSKELAPFSDRVFVDGAQLNVLERKPESLVIRFQFPIKSGEKAIEKSAKNAINQAIINWSDERRKA